MAAFDEAGFKPHSYTNTHDDQGTAGRYIYFDNVYLELLWVGDEEIAAANKKRCDTDTNARQAWNRQVGVSPVGIGMRDHDYEADPPAREHRYKADWMGPGADYLGVFTPEYRMNEPWVFRMPNHWTEPARQEFAPAGAAILEHPNGARVLTEIVFIRGDEPLVELTFDAGVQGETADFRPDIPLVIDY